LTKSSPSRYRDAGEIQVFRVFSERSRLGIVQKSIEKRPPPEPDILCCLENGEEIAFELVEVCNPRNARWFGSAASISRDLEQTYRTLPQESYVRFTERFASKPLSFDFAMDASLNRIRVMLPRAFEELLTQPENNDEFRTFSKAVQKVLISVRLAGRVETPGCPSFNVAGVFVPDVEVVDTVRSKLARKYETPYPIELLAYFGGRACSQDPSWKVPLQTFLKSHGFGPFRRVWVLGWDDISFVDPHPDSK
jgi:hypothetical protein